MKRKTFIIVILLLGLLLIQSFMSIIQKSPTIDETAHLPVGLSFFEKGDFRLDILHPPLARMIDAFPLLFMDVHTYYGLGWEKTDFGWFGFLSPIIILKEWMNRIVRQKASSTLFCLESSLMAAVGIIISLHF